MSESRKKSKEKKNKEKRNTGIWRKLIWEMTLEHDIWDFNYPSPYVDRACLGLELTTYI